MKSPKQLAEAIIDRANSSYHTPLAGAPYPPFAIDSMADRIRWSDHIKKVAKHVLAQELKGKSK